MSQTGVGKGTLAEAELLHGLVARALIERLESGEATGTDIRNAMDWLHRHGITRFVGEDTLEEIAEGIEETEGSQLPDFSVWDRDEDAA